MDEKKIGRVSATERNPNTCDEFTFWLENDIRIGPFDIVRVENNIGNTKSTSYGVIQDVFHITDSPGHLSNFVSSDFGDVDAEEITKKLSLSYAKATVIHNTDKNYNYMPLKDGSHVYTANEEDIRIALGLDIIPKGKSIPAGLFKTSNGVSVPISFNSDFLIGPEGAHLNISGISGLATKTSYAMFLLQAIQQQNDDIAVIILNVKGDDLLRIHEVNPKMNESAKKEWKKLGLECEPFKSVQYFYPYKMGRDKDYYNTSLNSMALSEQINDSIAFNYIYTFEKTKEKLDLLFSNVDDPNFTIESILNTVTNPDYFDASNWENFREELKKYTNTESRKKMGNQDIPVQSWKKFSRLIHNSINNDIFVTQKSEAKDKRQVHLCDCIRDVEAGGTYVVDIAKIDEQLQCLVFGDIIKTIYDLKHGGLDSEAKNKPRKIVIFVDELNKYAPSTSPKNSPILSQLLDITERGRQEGIILFSAEQFKSVIHDRVKGNCATHVYGRTNAIETSKPDYRYVPNVFSNMMTRLSKGDLIIQHPIFRTLLKVAFPCPSYKQGEEKNE